MPNLWCLLPDTAISVTYWAIHPCDDSYYEVEARCYGPHGFIGYDMTRSYWLREYHNQER